MLIAVFISVELFVVLLAIGLVFWCPWFVEKVGGLFTHGSQMYYILVGLPLAGLSVGFKVLSALLHPPDAEKKGLYKWPDYRFLMYYGYITMFLCITGVIVPIVFLLIHENISHLAMGAIYLAITFSWAISIITLGMAKLQISAILGGAE